MGFRQQELFSMIVGGTFSSELHASVLMEFIEHWFPEGGVAFAFRRRTRAVITNIAAQLWLKLQLVYSTYPFSLFCIIDPKLSDQSRRLRVSMFSNEGS